MQEMEHNPWLKALLILLVIIAGLYLVGLLWQLAVQFSDIILLFFMGWLIAFSLNPVVRLVASQRRLPRLLAVSIVYLGVLVIVVGLGFYLVPPAASQLLELGNTLTAYAAQVPEWLSQAEGWLRAHGIGVSLASLYQGQDLVQHIASIGAGFVQQALTIAYGIATVVGSVVIALVLSFYIQLDGERLSRGLSKALPQGRREELEFLVESMQHAFGWYMRGALLLGAVYALGTALVMRLLGLDYLLLVSAFSGVMMIIPLIGGILAIIPPLVIAAFTGSFAKVAIAFVALMALQQIVLQILQPKIMSHSLNMHPLLVFLALLAGAKVAGIWGLIFGVPVVAVIASMASFMYHRVNATDGGHDGGQASMGAEK